MRKVLLMVVSLLTVIVIASGCGNKNNVVGVWSCELFGSEQIIEFTDDGRFVDYTSGAVNRYELKNGNIVVFVEDVPDSKLEIPYKIENGKLIFGGAEYKYVADKTGNPEENAE